MHYDDSCTEYEAELTEAEAKVCYPTGATIEVDEEIEVCEGSEITINGDV